MIYFIYSSYDDFRHGIVHVPEVFRHWDANLFCASECFFEIFPLIWLLTPVAFFFYLLILLRVT